VRIVHAGHSLPIRAPESCHGAGRATYPRKEETDFAGFADESFGSPSPPTPEDDRTMLTQAEKGQVFRALHQRNGAFIIPNP
jgi:hypothetical protein